MIRAGRCAGLAVAALAAACASAPTNQEAPQTAKVDAPDAVVCVNPVDQAALSAVRSEIPKLDAPPERSGVGVLAIPEDRETFQKMNHMAVLGVRAFARKKAELPIGAVFFSPAGASGPGELPKPGVPAGKGPPVRIMPAIFPRQLLQQVPPGEARELLGSHTASGYFFVPVRLLRNAGILGIRFNHGSASIPIISLPVRELPDFLEASGEIPLPDPAKYPDPETTIRILRKNFCWGQAEESS